MLAGPVLIGIAGTVLPAIGLGPVGQGLGLGPFHQVLDWPGLPRATAVSVLSGVLSTLGALGVAALILAGWQGTATFRALERLLSPLLAVPHAAAALGLAFVIAPSGWIARLPAQALGWSVPPDLLILQDPWGLSLTAGLIAKELPFLLLMMLAALGQVEHRRRMAITRSLGHGRVAGWMKTVFPGVYAQVRLPVMVVLVYGMTNVDVATILGPNTPPTLSVQVTRWMLDPDLALRSVAAAGALVQVAAVAMTLALWVGAERLCAALGRAWIWSGRGLPETTLRALGVSLAGLSALALLAGLAALALWSLAAGWRFPDLAPEALTLRSWSRFGPEMIAVAGTTLAIAATATLLSLILVIGCLEAEHRFGLTVGQRALWFLYLPLLVPQVAFLPGLLLPAWLGVGPGTGVVIAGHVVFVLPYVFLSLSGPYRAWDTRIARVAAGLGATPDRILWRLRLPMLLAPVLTACAIGVAVSVGQYLPTLLLGAGRVSTLATEAVALAAGGNRRAIGVWGVGQSLAALMPFVLALAIPALVFRNRKAMVRD
ncbi:ABC transporter permease [Jannaschia sp. AI_61]|uniref:ABC transporter permease n=1 Tax=Jannaschia sp. AI_61 TaxID=2829796 RepID=UPI0021070BBE|nr:ABC transporter permease [Jannaschia sp. AI_61]